MSVAALGLPSNARVEPHGFADRDAMAVALAQAVAAELRSALLARGAATLAVPGGTTPRSFLRELRDQELDWARVTVTLTDERWVPPDHPDSNERMVRAELLAGAASAARWVALYTGEPDPQSAAEKVRSRVESLLPLDVLVLGMGDDGHVASLFPGRPELADGLDPRGPWVCGPGVAPNGVARMSLYAPALSSARWSALLVAGESKLAVLRRALGAGDVESRGLPVARILWEASSPFQVYWAS